ncbi:amino acid permease [Acidobacteria bacterium AH-259-A15]|nr:amino acid permease [Acidobacteria bacterium AH-259-A15]
MPQEKPPHGSVEKAGLIRDLSLFDITMVGVGAMIGAGIFVLTGIAAGTAGPALILAFSLNGVVTIFTAMVYAELGSAIPEAGGGYMWVKEGLPAWNAFLAGWMSWFAHAVAGSLYALGFGSYFELVLRNFHMSPFGLSGELLHKVLAVAVALLFVGINFKGVSETGKVGNVVTLGKIFILGIFIASGLLAIFRNPSYLDKLTPFAPEGMTGVLMAMGLTFIAFEGYEIIVQAGEEVKNPRKNIPKAIFLSLAIVIPIYLLVAFTALGAVNPQSGQATWEWLGQHAELGLAEAARQFMPLGTTLLLIGGLLSTMSALNATTFSSTRVSFAMGRDRNLPDLFSKIHWRTRTPHMALLFSGALIILMAVAVPIEDVAAAADVMFLLLFLQVNIAVVTVRKKYGDKLDYGYLIPFYPVLPIINTGLISFLAIFMFYFSALAWFVVIGWITAGFVIYSLYASRREREKEVTPIVLEERWVGPAEQFRVMVPIANPATAELNLQVASRIVQSMDGELLLLHVAAVAPQTPLSGGRQVLQQIRPVINRSADVARELGLQAHSLVRLSHQPSKGIIHTVEERKVDFVVMGWHGRSRDPRTLIGRNIDEVVKQSPCNVLVVRQDVSIPARHILIPIANAAHANLLLSVGRLLLSDDANRRITVLHVVPPEMAEETKQDRLDEIKSSLQQPGFFDPEGTEIRLDGNPVTLESEVSTDSVGTIAHRSREFDLMLIGSSQESFLRRRIFGGKPYLISQRAACPVIMISPETSPVKFSIQTFFQFFWELDQEAKAEKRH